MYFVTTIFHLSSGGFPTVLELIPSQRWLSIGWWDFKGSKGFPHIFSTFKFYIPYARHWETIRCKLKNRKKNAFLWPSQKNLTLAFFRAYPATILKAVLALPKRKIIVEEQKFPSPNVINIFFSSVQCRRGSRMNSVQGLNPGFHIKAKM